MARGLEGSITQKLHPGGLGSILYRLGLPDVVIQRILRHANVRSTATYYIKAAADDSRTVETWAT